MLNQVYLWDFWQREWDLGQAQIINSRDTVLKENVSSLNAVNLKRTTNWRTTREIFLCGNSTQLGKNLFFPFFLGSSDWRKSIRVWTFP